MISFFFFPLFLLPLLLPQIQIRFRFLVSFCFFQATSPAHVKDGTEDGVKDGMEDGVKDGVKGCCTKRRAAARSRRTAARSRRAAGAREGRPEARRRSTKPSSALGEREIRERRQIGERERGRSGERAEERERKKKKKRERELIGMLLYGGIPVIAQKDGY